MSQLALPLKLQDHAVFESFLSHGNEEVIAFLERMIAGGTEAGGWLRGSAATGKTHLLQAVCERARDDAQFIPLTDFAGVGPQILDGLATRNIVCIDDVDTVAGNSAWELGLFRLYNALADAGGILLCSASGAPRACGFELADLVSRFSRLPVFRLHALRDSQRIEALQLRARHRGLELPGDAASYLLSRSSRDMTSLYALLDKLDTEALVAKRRLTVPFVRQVLADRQSA